MNDTPHRARQFASDTYAGICPEAMEALVAANRDHAAAYGDDPWTARAAALLCDFFETDCHVFFVLTGTAANALALAALCQSYHSVLCHADAHIQTDECAAPEYAGKGIKLVPLPGRDGKLTPDVIATAVASRDDVHSPKPHVVSLSQATEVGTVYRPEELKAMSAAARERGLRVHVDGARFANALATLDVPPRAVTWEAGIDVLSFGGTKNGLAGGDLIVFFRRDLAEDFAFRRKQAGHLPAKMRFLAAPWVALLESNALLRNAWHANGMARMLERELSAFGQLRILYPVDANAVFIDMPAPWINGLHRRGWHFYTIGGGQRFMCSWDTTADDVAALVADLRTLV
ncbi:MAG: low specificity L-threonine aldolase [Gemmataceae bacterium]|nr:low specificity L-threonine aldolase [Gemmataceae bacterium]